MLTTTTPQVTFTADGATLAFDFAFKMWAATIDDEITVVYQDGESDEAVLALTTDYTLSAANNDYSSGGTVTLVTGSAYITSGKTITIKSTLPRSQTVGWDIGGDLNPDELEKVLDRDTRMIQEAELQGITVTSSPATAFMQTVLDDATALEARTTLGFTTANLLSGAVNVTDPPYSATGDGVTDDTTAIATAVATGKNVYFPAGTYLSDNFSLNSAGQILFGDGTEDTILVANEAGNFITADGKARFQIRDIYFKGGTGVGLEVGTNAIYITGASDRHYITRCRFQWWSGAAIYVDGTTSGVHGYMNNNINACPTGIHLESGDGYIINNDIGGSTTAGITYTGGGEKITFNSIYTCAIGLNIDMTGITGNRQYQHIVGNRLVENDIGIKIEGLGTSAYTWRNSVINSNIIIGKVSESYVGIWMNDVLRCEIGNNFFGLLEGVAIDVTDSQQLNVHDLTFVACQSDHLDLTDVIKSTFDNIHITNPGAVAGTAYIIKKTSTVTGNRFSGFNINAANANYYKVVNTGGSDNFYSNFQYQKENGFDAGWYDASDVIKDLIDLDATSVIHTLKDDATPSVDGSDTAGEGPESRWLTGGTTTITDFDNGFVGQIITVIAEHIVTITDGTNIFTPTGGNLTLQVTDTLTLIQKADGKWYTLSYSDNT